MVALQEGLDIKTLVVTTTNKLEDSLERIPPKHYLEKLKSSAGEALRDNVSYLQQATGKSVYRDLKGLQGL